MAHTKTRIWKSTGNAKTKCVTALLMTILFCSFLNAASAKVPCPRCNGTGEITRSKTCQACGGVVAPQPDITLKRPMAGASGTFAHPATSISGIFHNAGEVGAYGVATAQVRTPTETYTNTSERTYFPPNADTTVTVIVEGIEYQQYWACSIKLTEVESDGCPVCGGTGVLTETITCPDCHGTGFVDALPAADNSLIGVAAAVGVAVAVVIVAVFFVRRRRVTEESLRRLPPSEFQSWVLQRLAGKASSQRDSSMGIDGYTVEGYPLRIKQVGNVSRGEVESFASAMGRSRARTGVIVAFSFDQGTFEGTVRARLHYGFEIKTVTVRELLLGSGRPY